MDKLKFPTTLKEFREQFSEEAACFEFSPGLGRYKFFMQTGVNAGLAHKTLMSATFDDPSLIHDQH